jgi:hypothetical protein
MVSDRTITGCNLSQKVPEKAPYLRILFREWNYLPASMLARPYAPFPESVPEPAMVSSRSRTWGLNAERSGPMLRGTIPVRTKDLQ